MHPQVLIPKRTWEKQGPLYLPRYDRHPVPSHRRRSIPVPLASYSFINGASGGGTSSGVTGVMGDTTAGGGADLIIVGVVYSSSTIVFADSVPNTYSKTTVVSANSLNIVFYYCQSPTNSSTMNWEAINTASFASLTAMWFKGSTTSPLDAQPTGGGTGAVSGTSLQAGSLTPNFNNEVIVAALGGNASNTIPSVDSGFSIPIWTNFATPNGHYLIAMSYLIQTTAGAVNPKFSWGNSMVNIGTSASFKAAIGTTTDPPFLISQPTGHYRSDIVID
jgi:hypothetical protein